MTYTPEQIIEKLKLKDQGVFKFLYKKYAGMIRGYILKNSGSDEDALDFIQMVMLEFWISVQQNRYKEQGKMDHYIYQLTANMWREELRRKRNNPKVNMDESTHQIIDDGGSDLVRAVVKDKFLEALHKGIEEMMEPCKSIIQLYHLKKVSLQEIALQMNYNYDNLRKRIFDCRKKLKDRIESMVSKDPSLIEDAEMI